MITTFKKFKLKEKAKRNCVYLHVNFAGGDADTNHPEFYLIKGVTMDNIDEHLDEVNHMIDSFKTLKSVLRNSDAKYDDVKEKYGDEIASLFDNAPNDPQCDFEFKCYIDRMELHGFDDNGDLHTQYI